MWIGRQNELNDLQTRFEQRGFQLVAIYGRRRIGKTRLISEFIEGKRTVYYTATQNEPEIQLRDLTQAIAEAFSDNSLLSGMKTFQSFEAAFTFLAEEAASKRLIFVIDEYPYLAKAYTAISSVLQKMIDRKFKNTELYLILSGSSMSFMEKQLLGYESPLYGRRTGQIRLNPLPYYESIKFFPNWNQEDRLYAYGLCGGIPQYLEIAARWNSFSDAVENELLSATGGLHNEPEFLLKEELREPAVYNAIIDAVAKGKNKVNEIADAVHKPGATISAYLKNLLALDILERNMPIEETSAKKAIYQLKDPLFHFWYRFVPGCQFYIMMRKNHDAYLKKILPFLPEYFGHIFEEICLQYILRETQKGNLKEIYDTYGRWWGINPETRQQEDIDIACADSEHILTGECKWRNEAVDFGVYNTLKRRTLLIQKNRTPEYVLFSKAGFDEKLVSLNVDDPSLTLVGLEELTHEN
ncbi:MAG: ATP-binding protein [Eubacterium sp.]|nr:ATP-binding protein [Eubacterium sp.]